MKLTPFGPAGTAHDPFAGEPVDPGEQLDFPADRYAAIGASEEETVELADYFASLSRKEQREALAWHEEQTDEELTESLSRYRAGRDALVALGGLSEEERGKLAELSEEDRQVLAELDDEQREELVAYGEALDELAGLSEEDRAAVAELAQNAQESAQAGAGAPDGDSGAQTPQEGGSEAPAEFTTEQIADLTIKQVQEQVEAGTVSAQAALDAETARGDEARSSLVDWLTKRTQQA